MDAGCCGPTQNGPSLNALPIGTKAVISAASTPGIRRMRSVNCWYATRALDGVLATAGESPT